MGHPSTTENHNEEYSNPTLEVNSKPTKTQMGNRILFGVAGLLLALFLVMSQNFYSGRISALSTRVVQLRTQLEQRSSKSDCLALYRNDVSTALGLAVAANNRLWTSVAVRDPNLTEEQRAQDNARLGRELEEANKPLIRASQALSEYDALKVKPETCPHPNEGG